MAATKRSIALPADRYNPRFVARLFDEMSATYGFVNLLSSFGFCVLWRRQCLQLIQWRDRLRVVDLMSGMGELLPGIIRRLGRDVPVTAIDISPSMCRRALEQKARRNATGYEVVEGDALDPSVVAVEAADVVVSSFGLKTFSPEQIEILARQVRRLLKPGGQFAFVEISIPPSRLLRIPYLFYLRHVIPPIGKIFLGNPDNYRMLSVYTEAFGDCRQAAEAFAQAGLEVNVQRLFFGCATAVYGRRPSDGRGSST